MFGLEIPKPSNAEETAAASLPLSVPHPSLGNKKAKAATSVKNPSKCCTCPKTRCIKLYCDCRAFGRYCEGCACVDCLNKKEVNTDNNITLSIAKCRNPLIEISREALLSGNIHKPTFRGCQCKKSNCRKKYCECYSSGSSCSSQCKCEACMNHIKGNELKFTPMTSTPMTDETKTQRGSLKCAKRCASQFEPELYSNFTKKYSVQMSAKKLKTKY